MSARHWYGDGRADTLRLWPLALRVLRRLDLPSVEVGPADEDLLQALGLFVGGPDDEVEKFETAFVAELKKARVAALPVDVLSDVG